MSHDFYNKVDPARYEKEKAYIQSHRNTLKKCPYCNGSIKDRKVAVYKGLIDALYKVYVWCGKKRRHEFKTREIKELLGKNEYNRFGDLVRFGGIVYKPKRYGKTEKAVYGINMARAKEFFNGQREIPLQIVLDQISGEIISEVRGKVGDFPELSSFLKANGLYDHEIPVQEVLLKLDK